MLTYKKIVDSGVMTPSIATLLLTDDKDLQKKILSASSFIRRMHRICLFYRALVQAYVIGRAIDKDITVDKLGYSDRLSSSIVRCWPQKKGVNPAKNEMEIFSFLNDASCFLSSDAPAILEEIKELYEKSLDEGDRSTYVIEDEEYLQLLSIFTLLSVTHVDFETMKFSFPRDIKNADGERFEINCSPFIFFSKKNGVVDGAIEEYTTEGLALVSARKGEKNGDLLFDLTDFNLRKDGKGYFFRTIRRQAPKDEKLYQICRALGMDTDWYEIDEYLCNMAFLVRITEVTKRVLKGFWKKSLDPVFSAPSENVTKKLTAMLCEDADMCKSLNTYGKITLESLDKIFYGLYIEFGVFRTMRELLKETASNDYGKELFDEYMSCLVQMQSEGKGGITAEERELYEKDCDTNIDLRSKKLSAIISEKLPRYNKRMKAVTAEWRAYYVLKAAGIHADNLFADEESILSIDDYFSMIKNPSTTLKANLNAVLSLLTELYGSIVSVEGEFKEEIFRKRVLEIRAKNQERDTVELFDYLQNIVEKSENSEVIRRLLGRDSICNAKTLSNIAENIKKCISLDGEETEPSKVFTKKGVFISYAHENSDIVLEHVRDLQKEGYRVFLDTEKFDMGDSWKSMAQKEIRSPDCAAVLLFVSRASAVSKAVFFELEEVAEQNKKLLTVNIENDNAHEYLKYLDHHLTDPKKREYVSYMRDFLPSDILTGKEKSKIKSAVGKEVLCDNDDFIEARSYNAFELAVANFYAFLKFSDGTINKTDRFDWTDEGEIDKLFHNAAYEVSRCIYPLVTSVKETKIKRDNIALMGYEILRDKGEEKRGTNYIFSSTKLPPDDYYCIPNYRTTGEDGVWMVNPLMISHSLFRSETKEEK